MFGTSLLFKGLVGGVPQPPGTGAFLTTGANGMYISVDDGLTWSNDAFTGIDPTNGFDLDVIWTGSTFVTFQRGGYIWTSPDGYNWTNTAYYPDYDAILGMSYDPVNNETLLAPYKYNVGYAFIRSFDNGDTWSTQASWSSSSYGQYIQGVANYNGYAVVSGRTGQWRRSGLNNNWNWTSTSLGVEAYPIYNNGTWSAVENKDYLKYYHTTLAPPSYISTWTQVNGGGSLMTEVTKPAKNDIDTNVFTAVINSSRRLYISYDKGVNWTVGSFSLGNYTSVGYHNGKFYYTRNGELWAWAIPPFGTNAKVSNLSIQTSNFASMSITG